MTVRTAEKRRSIRVPAAYGATIRDRRGCALARGRTANISEHGVFIIAHPLARLPKAAQVYLEMILPSARDSHGRPWRRTVYYLCRIVRTERLGHLVAVGLEFVKKLT